MIMKTQCLSCKHLIADDDYPATCKAFPTGIPDSVWGMLHNHDYPYPGDNGVRFEGNSPGAASARQSMRDRHVYQFVAEEASHLNPGVEIMTLRRFRQADFTPRIKKPDSQDNVT